MPTSLVISPCLHMLHPLLWATLKLTLAPQADAYPLSNNTTPLAPTDNCCCCCVLSPELLCELQWLTDHTLLGVVIAHLGAAGGGGNVRNQHEGGGQCAESAGTPQHNLTIMCLAKEIQVM